MVYLQKFTTKTEYKDANLTNDCIVYLEDTNEIVLHIQGKEDIIFAKIVITDDNRIIIDDEYVSDGIKVCYTDDNGNIVSNYLPIFTV